MVVITVVGVMVRVVQVEGVVVVVGGERKGGGELAIYVILAQAPADNLLGMYKRVGGGGVGVRREAASITVYCTRRGGNRRCVLLMVFVWIWSSSPGGRAIRCRRPSLLARCGGVGGLLSQAF